MRDYTIRQLLRETEIAKYIDDPNSKVVEELELPITGARIDMAVINGVLTGYEIKSAVDTLKRLPGQMIAYSKVFDYLYIVTEGKHQQKVADILPAWVGLIICSEIKSTPRARIVRKAKKNTRQEGFYLAKLLWRQELLLLLDEYKIAHKKSERNWILCERLSENIKVKRLSALVRERLKQRPNDWKPQSSIISFEE